MAITEPTETKKPIESADPDTPKKVRKYAGAVTANDTKIHVGPEIAAPDITKFRNMQSSHPEQGLTFPELSDILLAAESGDISEAIDYFDAMEVKDAQYRTVISSRKMALAGLKCITEAASDLPDDVLAANLTARVLSTDWLADHLLNIMDAIGKGFSIMEIIWDYSSDGYLIPVDLKWRNQKFFTFRQSRTSEIGDGTFFYLKQNGGGGYDNVPIDKWPNNFLIHLPKGKSGLPITAGTSFAAAYIYLQKQILIKAWLGYSERYGSPPRVAQYPMGTNKADQDKLLTMLDKLGNNGSAIFQQGIDIKYLELQGQRGGSGGDKTYAELIHYLDDGMTKLALGQTLTTDNGGGRGSYALGAVHHAVRIDLLKADARQMANTLNKYIVKPMVDFNFGPQARYPTVKFNVQENIDLVTALSAAQGYSAMGVEIPVSYIRSIQSYPVPQIGPDGEKEACLIVPMMPVPGEGEVDEDGNPVKPTKLKPAGSSGLNPKTPGVKQKADPTSAPPSVSKSPNGKTSPSENKTVPLTEEAAPELLAAVVPIAPRIERHRVKVTMSELRKIMFKDGKSL